MTNKNIELNTTQNFQELSWDKISEEWEEIFNSFNANLLCMSTVRIFFTPEALSSLPTTPIVTISPPRNSLSCLAYPMYGIIA